MSKAKKEEKKSLKEKDAQHLRDDHESEGEAEEHQVHAVHPAQEDKVGRHGGAKVTWVETLN